MNSGLNVKAFVDFHKHVEELSKAVAADDSQRQLIALTQAIEALQDAKQAMVGRVGGILN